MFQNFVLSANRSFHANVIFFQYEILTFSIPKFKNLNSYGRLIDFKGSHTVISIPVVKNVKLDFKKGRSPAENEGEPNDLCLEKNSHRP